MEPSVLEVVQPAGEVSLAVREVDLPLAKVAVLVPQATLRCGDFLTEAGRFLLEERVTARKVRDALLEYLLCLDGGAVR